MFTCHLTRVPSLVLRETGKGRNQRMVGTWGRSVCRSQGVMVTGLESRGSPSAASRLLKKLD